MLPSHTITAFTPVTINAGHSTADGDIAVGAAALTVKVVARKVSFDLSTFILRPHHPPQELLAWIDERTGDDQATLSTYWPKRVVKALSQLPDAAYSSGIRNLAGRGSQPIIRLQVQDMTGFISLQKACAYAEIACGSTPAAERFAAWVKGDMDQIIVDAEIDAIATWRMTVAAIERKSRLGRELARVLHRHLVHWLRDTDRASTRAHERNLTPIAG
ncbi:hypothetical protein [Novosphingobium resinovorum]|uniref:Uncharacterized protein n=1 Tax=Novosphingobium resinovorum TaxID=158500 RepID=A0A1D8A2U9_9SPHN|nr:hypothetical protein [Novosphingobium resinovorum]AOR76448.1 hypothetical protein BES08_06560 [Novosphingobium resinovorum]